MVGTNTPMGFPSLFFVSNKFLLACLSCPSPRRAMFCIFKPSDKKGGKYDHKAWQTTRIATATVHFFCSDHINCERKRISESVGRISFCRRREIVPSAASHRLPIPNVVDLTFMHHICNLCVMFHDPNCSCCYNGIPLHHSLPVLQQTKLSPVEW